MYENVIEGAIYLNKSPLDYIFKHSLHMSILSMFFDKFYILLLRKCFSAVCVFTIGVLYLTIILMTVLNVAISKPSAETCSGSV